MTRSSSATNQKEKSSAQRPTPSASDQDSPSAQRPAANASARRGGERILLIRTSALGDIVHALPVLTDLRRQMPEATLGWVVERRFAPLLDGHADIDRLLVVATRPWRRRPASRRTAADILDFVRTLRRFEADVAVDLMGNHKAGVIARLSGARRRIGAARRDRREPSSRLWINHSVELDGDHVVDRTLSLVRGLDLEPPANADFAGHHLPGAQHPTPNARRPTPPILIQPGAGWGNKRYPPAWWGEVAIGLADAGHEPIGVLRGPDEAELARQVVAESDGRATALGELAWPQLVSTLRSARLVLGGDTGPAHLAHALDTPVVAVMGPTDPSRHGPYGAAGQAVFTRLPCSFCYRRFEDTKACLLEIAPERVIERALETLEPTDPPTTSTERG